MEIQRQKLIMEAFSSMKTTDNIKIEVCRYLENKTAYITNLHRFK